MRKNVASSHRLAFTTLEPIGSVVAVSAFNHPLNLIVHQVAPAIAAGNPVIFIIDKSQSKHATRRNYPVIGRFRYLFEEIGVFFRQYFFAMVGAYDWVESLCKTITRDIRSVWQVV